MECNKDEALKAKEIAKSKLRAGDFVGAQKFARKAQQLYPNLDNVYQILTVCDVHFSAQNRILGSEKDWYGILQIEQSADEATIKKQYRKLALILHPDKNKFSGAEAAFKLIGEAHRVLSDRTVRSAYDLKCRAAVRTSVQSQPQSAQWKPAVKKKKGTTSNFPNGPLQHGTANTVPRTPQFTGPHPFEDAEKTTFWTSCSNCGMRYQYYRTFVNKILRCQNCQQSFTAFDLGTNGVPQGFPWHQFHNQNGFPNPGPSNEASCNSGKPSGRNFSDKFTRFDPVVNGGNTSQAGGCSKTQEKVDGPANLKEDVRMPKPNVANGKESARIPKPNVLGTSRNPTRKRKRKSVIESDESCEASKCDEEVDVEVEENNSNFSRRNAGPDADQRLRRSSRHKQNIYYNEKISDNDFVSPVKKSKEGEPCHSNEELKEAGVPERVSKYGTSTGSAGHQRELKQKTNTVEESMPNKKSRNREFKAEGKEADILDGYGVNMLNPELVACPDSDFSDFDKNREENCFSVGQFWAIYDTCDGMPRFYARIKKVLSPGFKLQITWLEPNPDDESEKTWLEVKLPVSCGKFTTGRSIKTEDLPMFSHRVSWMNGGGKRFLVHPKVGETWAIFKDWDIKWSSDPEKHRRPYHYEFVEVLTEFDENVGIGVAYLDKVKGFVSLFKQTACHGVISFSIAPAHLYRFSHQIPSVKMTGKEREGVPVGSFEFDPASLPRSFNELDDPDDIKMGKENPVTKSNGLFSNSVEGKEKPMRPKSDPERENLMHRRVVSGSNREMPINNKVDAGQCINVKGGRKADERIKTPKKLTVVCGIDASKLRRAPRHLGEAQGEVNNHSDAKKVKKQRSILHYMESVSSGQSNNKMHLQARERTSTSFTESFNAPSYPFSDPKISESLCYDFQVERSEDKFESNQIWALYSDVDGMPKNYAQIKVIDFNPDLRLHVVLLEACSPPNSVQPVSCGAFTVENDKTKVFPHTAFSHRPKVEASDRNRFEIYPRKGEVWAVYKKGNMELAVPDRRKGECDIVEILEVHEQSIKVVLLSHVNGSKSLYRVPRSQRSKTGFLKIPRTDLSRFSHQIPAFQLTGGKNTELRGCWNLDPAALPGATPGATIIID